MEIVLPGKYIEKTQVMPCGYVDEITLDKEQKIVPLHELNSQGWAVLWDFNARFKNLWNEAAGMVKTGQASNEWEYGLVRGQTETEIAIGTTYLVRRKLPQVNQPSSV